ncbi:hydrogenobyrinic acid a,c-diamide synthase (glutamine-hydrolyzing) [Candidatus Bathyarchaeota archaeon]|nr:hydrogenobyrinic acid a,c-diamide synthase (glutamine-hydrolyzing) [Candidatus Bathyarchaeota archaeon]
MNVPRVVIAGLYGEGGKTTVATGLMGTFSKKGLKVQAFKSGPDHIDATYHNQVTKTPSRHLDAWLTSPRTVLESFQRSANNNDLAIIEGAGGIFQGIPREIDGISDFEGTAQIARLLKAPIILVLDIGSIWMHRAEVLHAMLHTFKVLSKQIRVKGVIINNVKGWQQAEWVKRAVKSATKLPVLGVIPYNQKIILPARRGGLVPIPEREELKFTLSDLVEHVEKNIEIDKIFEIAKQAEELPEIENKIYPSKKREKKVRIGIAFDEAFSCHNQDNLDLLEAYGAETVFFSPIHDKELPPNLDGLYFTSGFPERVSEQLAANQTIIKKIKESAYDEMPIYCEHGGSMYLTKSITTFEGSKFPMVGIFSGESEMDWKMQALDSTQMETINDNILTKKGKIIHGNDFRFSRIINIPKDTKFGYKMKNGKGIDGKHEGLMENNVMAVMGVIYFAFDTKIGENFVKLSEEYNHK